MHLNTPLSEAHGKLDERRMRASGERERDGGERARGATATLRKTEELKWWWGGHGLI